MVRLLASCPRALPLTVPFTSSAIQLLRYLSFSSVIAYASKHHLDHLKSLGVTDFIERDTVPLANLANAAKSITPNPIEVVYDAFSSAESQQVGYDALVPGGKIVVTLGDQVARKTDGDGKKVLGVIGNSQRDVNREFGKTIAREMSKLLEEGIIVVGFIVLYSGLD
jgi:hypothetical protein